MHFFLLHCSLLFPLCFLGARSLWSATGDRFLGTVALAWGNIVATCLILACAEGLGDRGWFFRLSLLIALGSWLVLRRVRSPAPPGPLDPAPLSRRLLIVMALALLPVAWASLRIAATYEPNNYDSLTYHLPRVMFYLGQNDFAHFATGNDRQIYFPFNFNLLQLFPLAYSAPLQTLNFVNLCFWAVAGVAVYRLARLAGFSRNASLTSSWLALTATQILAQATATTNDLPSGVGVLVTLVFILRWRHSRLWRDSLFAGLAAGLTAGSKLTILFFGPAAALIVLGLAWQHVRRGEIGAYFRAVRSWLPAAALAMAVAAPFAIINLAEKGEWINHTYDYTLNRPFSAGSVAQTTKAYFVQLFAEPIHRFAFDPKFSEQLNTWGQQTFFPRWNEAWAFSELHLFPLDLNEDHVFFGFAGPLAALCAAWVLLRWRRASAPEVWLALLGLGWFASYFILNKWSLYNQRYFVLPLLVLSPGLAAMIDGPARHSLGWLLNRITLVLVGAAAIWLAGLYLFHNSSRPYAPLWRDQAPPPALAELPPLIGHRLGSQTRINFDSTDGNERAFLFMTFGRDQRFTAFDRTLDKAYNVFSLWGFVRKVIYSNIEQRSSYTIVKFPSKRTAGVEYLGTVGVGQPALDYYGLAPFPDTVAASDDDRNVMVKFLYDRREPNRFSAMRIRAIGLNPSDRARLVVGVEYTDQTSSTLATFTTSAEAPTPVTKPFSHFTLRLEDIDTGEPLGGTDLPYLFRSLPPDVEAPDDPSLLFADELVTHHPQNHLTVQGLGAPEGPYPEWRLPLIRRAISPNLRFEVPPTDQLRRLELTFSARLDARSSAQMDLLVNGRVARTITLQGGTEWQEHTIPFVADPGRNVIELRNVVVEDATDWLDYLDRYPDVKAYVLSQGVPLEEGARQHFETHGRNEHRELKSKRRLETLPGDAPTYYLFRTIRLSGFRSP